MTNQKAFKCFNINKTSNFRIVSMFPSDPKGSLDETFYIQVPGMALRSNAGLPIHSSLAIFNLRVRL